MPRTPIHGIGASAPTMLLILSVSVCDAGGATVSWDGGAGTSAWTDATNWSGDVLPGPADDVVIDAPGALTVILGSGAHSIASLSCADSLAISGGSLSAAFASSVAGACSIGTGATFGGAGNLSIDGALSWTGGTLQGPGKLIVSPDAGATISSAAHVLDRSVDNYGVVEWTGGSLGNGPAAPAVVTNLPGAKLIISGTASFLANAQGANLLVNSGTLVRTGAGQSNFSGAVLENSAELVVEGGTLLLTAGLSNTGSIDIAPEATLSMANTGMSAAGAPVLVGGALVVTGGSYTFGGPLSVSGMVTLSGGTTTFAAGAFATLAGLTISSGTVTINDPIAPTDFTGIGNATVTFNAPVTLPLLTISTAATLKGDGDVSVLGPGTWLGGTMSGSGKTILAATSTFAIQGAPHSLFRTIENHGALTWTAGNIGGGAGAPGIISNTVDGTMVFSANATFSPTSNPSQILNAGTLQRTGGGTTTMAANTVLNNTGTVEVIGGMFTVNGTVTQYSAATATLSAGCWIVRDGATLKFPEAGVIRTLTAPAKVALDGAGSVFAPVGSLTTIGPGATFQLTGGRDLAAGPQGMLLQNLGALALDPLSTLSVAGSFENVDGAEYRVGIDSGSSGAIAADAVATLAGALVLELTGDVPEPATTFTIVSAASVLGSFASVALEAFPRGLKAIVTTSATEVQVSIAERSDLNADGVINGADLALLLLEWDETGLGLAGDVNGDGTVNGADLGQLLADWG